DLTTVLTRHALLLMATSRRSIVSVEATPWWAIGRSFNADFHGPKPPHISEAVAPTFSQNSKIPGGLV
ncbi:MAG TPA: hypothetical protein VKP69_31445, partial [Isosphaeraceae bacterium]|nr:hypothetical protein [Isosphaeraceae bacterium]